ncbi:MAG: AMP-binding protein, partial [Bacteroidota bacterium]|nr:AMP-binding protein [Bacteroidota bacterium]
MTIERVFDILNFAYQKYGDKTAIAGKKHGKWIEYSFLDCINNANYVSAALLEAGVQKGDLILNISDNRPEWNFADIGILQIGAVHVPVFPTINIVELEYIIKEVNPSIIFLSNRFAAQRVKKILAGNTEVRVIALDDSAESEKFSDFMELGKREFSASKIEKIKEEVSRKDLASIIYTSGTTTMPKGVMLSHDNHVSNVLVAGHLIGIDHTMNRVCYLPLSHSYERMVGYISLYRGMAVYYNENMVNILSNFITVKPSILVTVPLLLERIYKGVIDKHEDL